MNTNVIAFNFGTAVVRTVDLDGEVWFVAADVCKVLGIQNATYALIPVDEEDRAIFDIGGSRTANIINESGLYTLLLRSDKPEARPFRRWVTKEVLPAIRKKGGYIAAEAAITPEEVEALLSRPVIISVAQFLALKAGTTGTQSEQQNGQHYSDETRTQVLDLGDKGWMPAEIADRTGVPIATVKTMLFRARKAGKIAKGPRQGTRARDKKHSQSSPPV